MTDAEVTDLRDTPYLALDVEVMDRNIAAMAGFAAERGLALRPHAKTHKCVPIGARQLAAGATGLTVATVAEAEVFAAAGVGDLFLAYPIWAAGRRAARLRALAERCSLRVGLDSVPAAHLLARALAGTSAQVVVELDSGHGRSGVQPDEAGALGASAARLALDVVGAFTFPGHGYGPGAQARAAADEAAALARGAAALDRAGLPADVRSGGSTPTAALVDPGVLTELRPGVYLLGDAQQWELGTCDPAEIALTAVATVVSAAGERVILDAGSKTLGADRAAWSTGYGRLPDLPDARIVALSEHHATVDLTDVAAERRPSLGDRVRVAPNHVCAAVNLADELVVDTGDGGTDGWPVAARGANT